MVPATSPRRHSQLNFFSLQWRHNGHDGVSNHRPHHCLLKRLFRSRSKKTSKLRVTGLCAGNSPVTGEFPAQLDSGAENFSIWWRHHVLLLFQKAGCIMEGNHGLLFSAVNSGDIRRVRTLLYGYCYLDKETQESINRSFVCPLLHCAILNGDCQVLRLLLDAGWTTGFQDSLGNSELMFALGCRNGFDMVTILINAGADLNYVNKYGDNALTEYLAQFVTNPVDLDLSMMDLLISAGIDVDFRNRIGFSALHLACDMQSTSCEVVRRLLSAGCHVDAEDVDGQTPLMLTAASPAVTAVLLQAGADPSHNDRFDNTALQRAISNVSPAVVRHLVMYNVDVSKPFIAPGCFGLTHAPFPYTLSRIFALLRTVTFITRNDRLVPNNGCLRKWDYVKSHCQMLEMLVLGGADVYNYGEHKETIKCLELALLILPLESNSIYIERCRAIIQHVLYTLRNPSPLLEMCRQTIRSRLRPNFQSKLDALRLPRVIRDFIRISELPDAEDWSLKV